VPLITLGIGLAFAAIAAGCFIASRMGSASGQKQAVAKKLLSS
jgi:hypothetical protein